MREPHAIKRFAIVEVMVLVLAASCGRVYYEDVPASGDTVRDASTSDPNSFDPTTDAGSGDPEPSDGAPTDAADAADAALVESATILSPYEPSNTLTYARAIDWTIAAFDPAMSIFYTTDGTTPSLSSSSAKGSVTLPAVADATAIRWITGPNDIVRTFNVKVNPSIAEQFIVHRLAFDQTKTPVVRVKAGTTIAGTASIHIWSDQCPNCILQIMVGISIPQTCLYNGVPNKYPGVAQDNVAFQIPAPATLGTYELKAAYNAHFSCAQALQTTLSSVVLGKVIVE